jgi:hypothetical protein
MRRIAICLALVLLCAAPLANAQGVGFVGGGSIDPEQFYAGTFFETPVIAQGVRIRPGVEGSWGEGLRMASINIDIIRRSDITSGWQFYTGGGPVILITRVSDSARIPDPEREEDVTGGLAALVGFMHQSGFLTEFKFGHTGNGTVLKFGAGFRVGGNRTP